MTLVHFDYKTFSLREEACGKSHPPLPSARTSYIVSESRHMVNVEP